MLWGHRPLNLRGGDLAHNTRAFKSLKEEGAERQRKRRGGGEEEGVPLPYILNFVRCGGPKGVAIIQNLCHLKGELCSILVKLLDLLDHLQNMAQ